MMREILFRGKKVDTGKGEWVFGDLISTDANRIVNLCASTNYDYYVFEETIGQYTGLKDKNGNKIFEGYILKRKSFKYNLVVCFGEDEPCSFEVKSVGTNLVYSLNSNEVQEIIGNINDNPELLEGDNR